MSVPKRRQTSSRSRRRRSHHGAATATVSVCANCSGPIQPHTACPGCGQYKGQQVVKKVSTAEKKMVAKQAKAAKPEAKKEEPAKAEK